MKYIDLLEQLSKLTPEQLQKPAKAMGIDMPIFEIGELWIAEENYINPSGDGAEPASTYANDPEFRIEDEAVVIVKGTAILAEVDAENPVQTGTIADLVRTGVELIAEERQRQISKFGYDADHDKDYRGEMAKAGACYADTAAMQIAKGVKVLPPCFWHKEWPWRPETFRGESALSNLVRAGALIAAEIDRVLMEAE